MDGFCLLFYFLNTCVNICGYRCVFVFLRTISQGDSLLFLSRKKYVLLSYCGRHEAQFKRTIDCRNFLLCAYVLRLPRCCTQQTVVANHKTDFRFYLWVECRVCCSSENAKSWAAPQRTIRFNAK